MTEFMLLQQEIERCEKCALSESRTHAVVGEGDVQARLMLIGEGPGAEEDKQGRPFVGAAGKLLDQMLDAIGLARENVYIANIVKCRPPQNRAPKPDETNACIGYLLRQIRLIQPDVMLLLGATALNAVLSKDLRITKDRGKWMKFEGRDVLATFHPAALLRDPSKKPLSFDDMLAVKIRLEQNRYVSPNA